MKGRSQETVGFLKCISKDRDGKPCNFSKVGDTKFCKFHQHMVDYTDEMLDQIKSCSTCRKMFYLGEYTTCEGCRNRGKQNRDEKRETTVKCFKEGCSYKKSKENKYCGKHQIEMFLDETKEEGVKPCPNYVRGCREKLNLEYSYSKCQNCLKVDRDKDHEKRGAAAESVKEDGMKTCSVCCKKQEESEFIGLHGETKTCRDCRDAFKRADEKRDNEHVKELARENSQKPERKEVKKEWRENNKDKVLEYSRSYRRRKIEEDVEGYLSLKAEVLKKWKENNPEWVSEFNKDRRENIKYKFGVYISSSKKRNIEFSLTEEDFNNIIKLECHYCGMIDNVGFNGIDRVDSDGIYSLENCVPCCKMCNYMKCALDKELFICICEHITSFNKLNENGRLFEEAFYDYTPNYSSYKNNAERRNINFEITKDEFSFKITEPCYICGKKNSPIHKNGIDRFDSKDSYNSTNIRSCCGTCNYMKKDYDYDKFIEKCKQIYEHNKDKYTFEIIKPSHFMGK